MQNIELTDEQRVDMVESSDEEFTVAWCNLLTGV